MSRAGNDPTRAQRNAFIGVHSTPSLQTPRPTQAYHGYQPLLNNQTVPPRSYSTSTSSNSTQRTQSTTPSPSSTLYSTSTQALRDPEVRKLFSPGFPQPSLQATLESSVSPNKASYELWMLSPEAAPYAAVFPPVECDYDEANMRTPVQRDFAAANAKLQKKYLEPLKALPTPPCQWPVGPYSRWRKPWMDFFDQGCVVHDHDSRVMFARKVVQNEKWDDDRLLDLARVFIWRASDEAAENRDMLPIFASRIREAFEILAPQSGLAGRFVETLSRSVLATFASQWHVHKDHRKAIVFNMEHKPSFHTYVVAALLLCLFIGDLYIEKFLSRLDTIGCVRIIFRNLALVEHLTAMNNILRRAGTRLWKEAGKDMDQEVHDFKEEMVKAAKKVQDHRFVLTNRPPMRGTVKAKIEGLVKYVEECARFVREGGRGGGPLRAIRP